MSGCVATIGFFDGVHKGHRFVIGSVAAEARRRSMCAVVLTFDLRPRDVVAGTTPPAVLTSLEDKRRLIVEAGADRCEVLHFDRELASLSAREFMGEVLRDRFGVRVLLLGYDNRFGRRREEGFEDYVAYGRELGIEVVRLQQLGDVSSSAIRQALSDGDMSRANDLLGRRYCLTGTVVHGFGEGRKLHFPTANLSPESIVQQLPGRGVYEVELAIGPSRYAGMMNIGLRPTYGGSDLSVEIHLLDFSGDLYGREVSVEVVRRIREERRFESTEELRRQLEQDRDGIERLKH